MKNIKKYLPENVSEVFFLSAIVSVAFAVRIYLLIEYPHVLFRNEADAVGYFAIAKSLLSNWGLGETSVHFPPFYPFVIAVASLIIEDIESAGRVASCIMGGLLIFPVYLIGKELHGKKTGFYAAIVTIFFSEFIELSLSPLSQTTYLTLLMTGIYFGIISITNPSSILYILLGMTFGAAYLTRPEGLLGFVVVTFIITTFLFNDSSIKGQRKLKAAFLMFVGFLILAIPYINYLHDQTGIWTISGKGATTIIGVDTSAKLLPSGITLGESMVGKVGVDELFSSPRELVNAYLVNVAKFITLLLDRIPVSYTILSFIGLSAHVAAITLGSGLKKNKTFQSAIFFAGCVAPVLPVFAFSNLSPSLSYILPLFPILIIWLTIGLASVEDRLLKLMSLIGVPKVENIRKMSLISIVVILFYIFTSVMMLWKYQSSSLAASENFLLKDTGVWLKNNTPKDASIMSRWSNIGFYAERRFVYLPDGEISEVVQYAREHDVRYIVIDSDSIPRRRPKLAPLISPGNHQGLRLANVREKYRITILIYEVLSGELN